MDHYETEEQQVEAIKRWWRENGAAVIAGIAIGVALILGWQWWVSHRTQQAEVASAHFDVLTQAVDGGDIDAARARGETLRSEFASTPYAALAALALAGHDAGEGRLEAAAEQLRWVAGESSHAEFADIARVRLAQVLLAAGQPAEALTTLEGVKAPAFEARAAELRGDILVAMDDPQGARRAYEEARESRGLAADDGLLALKIASLPAVE